ncbi:MAG: hypothetical protein AAF901_13100 [Bacteroidota bacterium]
MKIKYLILSLLVICFSCSDDDSPPNDDFEQLIGQWRITGRTIDNIGLLIFPDGNFVFQDDANTSDSRGVATYSDVGPAVDLTFELSTSQRTITFTDEDNDQTVYGYEFADSDNTLIFTYTTSEGFVAENWERQ